ncbi:hypothetical protein KRR55_16815 [Paeniglutamicibacter sp. ABSL32-1]|nr:hypothetical protein [Paeniglutamicibacter quisquiliarum]MBV1780777.1 hypothetical protein [Paeniglutamicibacter quisquiliarum]
MASVILGLANAGDLADGPVETMNNNEQFTVGQEHRLDPAGGPGDRKDSA